jgi:hypothetical protein
MALHGCIQLLHPSAPCLRKEEEKRSKEEEEKNV